MMPKFGNITNPSENILDEIKTVKSLGFDFVEIGVEGPEGKPEIIVRNKSKILQLLKNFNSKPVVHTSWWVELGSDYELVRKAWVEEGKIIIKLSKMVGSSVTNFHANAKGMYLRTDDSKKMVLKNMSRSLNELTKFGKIHDIGVMLENMPPGGISDIEDYNYLMKKVKDLKLHLDVGHAFIGRGMGHIEKYIKKFKKRIAHVHVSDNHGNDDEHLPLGIAMIDYRHVVKLLKDASYDKTVTFEVFNPDRELSRDSMQYFVNLWKRA